jgi:molybdopterin molybdotransferase
LNLGETILSTLLSVSQAQSIILEAIHTLDSEIVPLRQACNRILFTPLYAANDLPPFTNSSADGFAVRAADTQAASITMPVKLTVVADIPAGSNPAIRISTGQAARIMTGAPLPEGTDAVVMIEDTDAFARGVDAPAPEQVGIHKSVKPGDSVRPHGQDLSAGTILFKTGHRLRPQDVGLLASLGFAQIAVYRRPRIALLSSGDELLDPGEPLQPGKIHDANSYLLSSLLEEYGAIVTYAGFVHDDEVAIRTRLDEYANSGIDLLITSAGVSVGAFDFVRKVITEHGDLAFWKVNMRPGKPLTFGNYRGIPVVGLPGNPVSAFVGCLVFVIPAIKKMQGIINLQATSLRAKLLEPAESDGRESYLRVYLDNQAGNWTVKLSGHQGSGNLFALTRSNALLFLPSGVKSLPAGADVIVYPLFHDVVWE